MDPNSFGSGLLLAIASATVGVVVKEALSGKIRIKPRPKWRDIVGDWFGYYLITKDGKVEPPHGEVFHIKPNYLGSDGFRLTVTIPGQDDVQYRGTAEKEPDSGYFIIQMKPAGRNEKIFFRFTYPMAAKEPKIVYGLYSALDFSNTGLAVVGPAILSRRQISDEDVIAMIKANFRVHLEGVIWIRPQAEAS
jgi:hypothetical protein